MKLTKTLLITPLMLLLAAGFMLYSCAGGSTPPIAENLNTTRTNVKEEETSAVKSESAEPVSEEWKNNKGIGPVKSVTLAGTVDQAMADAGGKIYKEKCTSCHKPDKRFIGPSPKGVFERRTPEWVMNMILNPEQMVKEDPIAKQLLLEYNLSPMANQNLTEAEARNVLEYFRTL